MDGHQEGWYARPHRRVKYFAGQSPGGSFEFESYSHRASARCLGGMLTKKPFKRFLVTCPGGHTALKRGVNEMD